MKSKDRLTRDQFCFIVRHTPLVAIDLILSDPSGAILVGLRHNEPAKGTWFVPGGIIFKNEKMDAAFQRILDAETGLSARMADAVRLGVYEHFYSTNRFSEEGYGTHYIVNAFRLPFATRPSVRTDDQHSVMRWMSAEEALTAAEVHPNTKTYFR